MTIADILVFVGLISLALGAISGFAVLAAVDYPDLLVKLKVVDPGRVRQTHLDWIMMGLLMVAVGLAVPFLPVWIGTLILFGAVVNPATFIPMAFSRTVASTWVFKAVSFVSFTSLSVGLVGAVVSFVI
jgi:hypothetical protein